VPVLKSEIKLNLKNWKPFSCAPWQLAYAEKEIWQKLLDDYFENGII